jgi:hypothetical protein
MPEKKVMLEFLAWLSQVCVYLVWTELSMVGEQKETDYMRALRIGCMCFFTWPAEKRRC